MAGSRKSTPPAAKTDLATTPKKSQPLDAATEEKVHQIFIWILEGQSEHDVLNAAEKTWPDDKTQPLIVTALKRIEGAANPEPDVLIGFAIEATRTIYQKAFDVGDHQTALRALKQMVELAGK